MMRDELSRREQAARGIVTSKHGGVPQPDQEWLRFCRTIARCTTVFMAVCLLLLLALALATAACSAYAKEKPRAWFFAGFGDAAALGVQDIAAKARTCGLEVSTHPHGAWSQIVNDVRAVSLSRRRVVLAGHSMGGVAAVSLATAAAPYRIDLVVTFDPAASVGPIPKNVRRALNLYQNGFLGGGRPLGARHTEIPAGHIGFPSDPAVQRKALAAICAP